MLLFFHVQPNIVNVQPASLTLPLSQVTQTIVINTALQSVKMKENMMVEKLNPPAMYGEQVAGRAARVRTKLKDLTNDVKASTFDLADLLFEAQENNYPAAWGYASTLE